MSYSKKSTGSAIWHKLITYGVISLVVGLIGASAHAQEVHIPVKFGDKVPLSADSQALLTGASVSFSDLLVPGLQDGRKVHFDVGSKTGLPAVKVKGATLYTDITKIPGCEPHKFPTAKWREAAKEHSDKQKSFDALAADSAKQGEVSAAEKLQRQQQIGIVGSMTTYTSAKDTFGNTISPVVKAAGGPACAAAMKMEFHKGKPKCTITGGYSSHMPNSWVSDSRTKCVLYQVGYIGFDETLLPYPLAFQPPLKVGDQMVPKGPQFDTDSTPKGLTVSDGKTFNAIGVYPNWALAWGKKQPWAGKIKDTEQTWNNAKYNDKKGYLQNVFHEYFYVARGEASAPVRLALFADSSSEVKLNPKLYQAAQPYGNGVHLIKFEGKNAKEVLSEVAKVDAILTKLNCPPGTPDAKCPKVRVFTDGELYLTKESGPKYTWRNAYNKGELKLDSKVTEVLKVFPFRVATARDKSSVTSPVYIPHSMLTNRVHFRHVK